MYSTKTSHILDGTRVTDRCTNAADTCIDCHASCNGTVCDCDDGYSWNGTHCGILIFISNIHVVSNWCIMKIKILRILSSCFLYDCSYYDKWEKNTDNCSLIM